MDAFAAYLREKHLSNNNSRSVLATISKLVTGTGLCRAHEKQPSFMVGEPIDVYSVDVDDLKRRAEAWVPLATDKSHGWRWNHPLGYLAKFQEETRSHRRMSDPPLLAITEVEEDAPSEATADADDDAVSDSGSDASLPNPDADERAEDVPGAVGAFVVDPPPPHPTPRAAGGTGHEKMELQLPTAMQQLLRACGSIPPLHDYLKTNDAFRFSGSKQWSYIRRWIGTREGYEWVQSSGLDPYSVHLHHIKAASRGGLYSVFNCALVPGSMNSKFGAKDSETMRAFVGKSACELSDAHARWHAKKTAQAVDQTSFKAILF